MVTLFEYFNNDFKDLSLDADLPVNMPVPGAADESITIKRRVRQEIRSSSRLFTFYIPKFSAPIRLITEIVGNLDEHKKQIEGLEVIGGFSEDVHVGTHQSVYSDRVYFYTETPLTKDEISYLDNICKQKQLFVTIRSVDYLKRKMEIEKPLAFISHDSRDKEIIAKPIADGLNSRLCFVWYDEYSLKIGQSLRESIEKGIKEAKKCILVITPNFLNNPGWTKKEFNSIFTREMIFNERIVLPVWFNVTKENVYEYSPSLADTVALKWPDSSLLNEEDYKKGVEIIISKIHTEVTQ